MDKEPLIEVINESENDRFTEEMDKICDDLNAIRDINMSCHEISQQNQQILENINKSIDIFETKQSFFSTNKFKLGLIVITLVGINAPIGILFGLKIGLITAAATVSMSGISLIPVKSK
jgi:tetrahydromethanopterin S-methyltransferase subunit G